MHVHIFESLQLVCRERTILYKCQDKQIDLFPFYFFVYTFSIIYRENSTEISII